MQCLLISKRRVTSPLSFLLVARGRCARLADSDQGHMFASIDGL
jgi:hypothetical protein